MIKGASRYLNLDELSQNNGRDKWHGGLAIANIRNPDSGVGHFVVLLSEINGIIRYYCPYHGSEIHIAREKMVWTNGDGTLSNWVINLEKQDLENGYSGYSFVFILADPKNELIIDSDTSIVIEQAYKERGQPVFWVHENEISVIGTRLYLGGLPVGPRDIVWIRLNPVNTVRYYEIVRLLANVKNVNFLNDPAAILLRHDKHAAVEYRRGTMTICVSSHVEVRRAIKHLDWRYDTSNGYVVKSPSGFGGNGVVRAYNHNDVMSVFDAMVAESGYVIIESFQKNKENQPIDTRVFVANGEIIGIADRVAKENEWLCNSESGALIRAAEFIPVLALTIAKNLQEEGVFCAGLDFLNGELTEINITCPGMIPEINEIHGSRVDKDLINQADSWAGQNHSVKA